MKKDSTAYAAVIPTYDKSDCSVRALAVATGCTYQQSSAIFSAAGRKLKKGTFVETSLKVYVEWLGCEELKVREWPLAGFIAAYPKGRFILHRKGHAFAVIDGVLHDWAGGKTWQGSLLTHGYEVTEKAILKMERIKGMFE